jgi:hypothetical protein
MGLDRVVVTGIPTTTRNSPGRFLLAQTLEKLMNALSAAFI